MTPVETLPAPTTAAPRLRPDLPIIYEDDGYEDMGDTNFHSTTGDVILYGLRATSRACRASPCTPT